jgi:hypothetical protein
MVIQGEFFQIIPVNEHSTFFDLKLLYTINGKTSTRQEYKDVSYGVTLETAIRQCIQFALHNKFETLTLKEYLKEYKKLYKELNLLVNESN